MAVHNNSVMTTGTVQPYFTKRTGSKNGPMNSAKIAPTIQVMGTKNHLRCIRPQITRARATAESTHPTNAENGDLPESNYILCPHISVEPQKAQLFYESWLSSFHTASRSLSRQLSHSSFPSFTAAPRRAESAPSSQPRVRGSVRSSLSPTRPQGGEANPGKPIR